MHDANAVADVMDLVANTMINPFDNDYESLVHVCNGSVASTYIESDMKNMYERVEAAALAYIRTNILSEKPDIYKPIKKIKLKIFSSIDKKITSKTKKGEILALKNSKKLFAKRILIARSRDLDMKNMQYSLVLFPSLLATTDGNLVKTSKSKLLSTIEIENQNSLVKTLTAEMLSSLMPWL